MAFLSRAFPPPGPPLYLQGQSNPLSLLHPSSLILSFPFHRPSLNLHVCALKTGSNESDLLRKPLEARRKFSEEEEENERKGNHKKRDEREEGWDNWEDQILSETAPLVGFVRMILHSNTYRSGDRLRPEHQRTIIERLLPYHPECDEKIGCGIDYITVGYHPDFEGSRCLFIVRKDGELIDFSYWKCMRGLIRKNYPQYARSFIRKHFWDKKGE